MSLTRKFIIEQLAKKHISRDAAKKMLEELGAGVPKKSRDIAIVGIGSKIPGAKNNQEFWTNLAGGVESITDFPAARRKDTDVFFTNPAVAKRIGLPYVKEDSVDKMYLPGGYLEEIDKFDNDFFNIPPNEAKSMDPYQRLLLETVYEAFEDAGVTRDKIEGRKVGVYIGRDHTLDTFYAQLINNRELLTLIGSWTGILASRISYLFNLMGPSLVIDTACSSALVSINTACNAINNNEVEMAVAGGIAVGCGRIKTDSGMMMVEAADNKVRTFDKGAAGTVWSEGSGIVILKPLQKALDHKDRIYGVIKGGAVNNDGASNGITAPSAEAQEQLLLDAWKNAGINPETISYIEAHGTGTNLGDPIEIKALTGAMSRYTRKKQYCAIGSVKTNIGHTQAASGVLSLIKVVLSMKNSQLPPSLHFDDPNPFINFINSPFYVNTDLRPWETGDTPKRSCISAFGFSGTNCHLVVEEAPASIEQETAREIKPYILPLSAKSKSALTAIIGRIQKVLQEDTPALRDILFTLSTGRNHYSHRFVLQADSKAELLEKLLSIHEPCSRENEGIFYGFHRLKSTKSGSDEQGNISEREKQSKSDDARQQLDLVLQSQGAEKNEAANRLCALYAGGADVNWEKIYDSINTKIVSLPAYPFERKRFWVDIEPGPSDDNSYFSLEWVEQPLVSSGTAEHKTIMILMDTRGIGENMAAGFIKGGKKVIKVYLSDGFEHIKDNEYRVGCTEQDYEQLFSSIDVKKLDLILSLFTIGKTPEVQTFDHFESAQQTGMYALFYMSRALLAHSITETVDLLLITENLHKVRGNETVLHTEYAGFEGLGKVIGKEYPAILCRHIDIDEKTDYSTLMKECEQKSSYYAAAYRDNLRYGRQLKKADLHNYRESTISVKKDGIYLITGGTGGLGLEIAHYLAGKNSCTLVLVNRTPLPERAQWQSILGTGANGANGESKENKKSNRLQQQIRKVLEIENGGSRVYSYKADISREDEVAALVSRIKEEHGQINGIVHSAGVAGEGYLIKKDFETFRQVTASKIEGTWLLDHYTRKPGLDFFVLFSSIASLAGIPGQSDYTAANSYLDAFAVNSRSSTNVKVINWPAWEGTGMANDNSFHNRAMFKDISIKKGLEAFDRILQKDIVQVIPGSLRRSGTIRANLDELPFSIEPALARSLQEAGDAEEEKVVPAVQKTVKEGVNVKLKGDKQNRYSEKENQIGTIWMDVLGFEEFDVTDNFFDIGGDSIMISQIHQQVEDAYPGRISVADIFSAPTIRTLAGLIESKDRTVKESVVVKQTLPAAFFTKNSQNNKAIFKIELQAPYFQNWQAISAKEGIDLPQLLFAVYANLIADAAKTKGVSINAVLTGIDNLLAAEIDLENIEELSELFKTVNTITGSTGQVPLTSVQADSNPGLDSKDVSILFYNTELVSRSSEPDKIFDLTVSLTIMKDGLLIQSKFNEKRLQKEQVKKLFNHYIASLQYIGKSEQ